jgi:hypothetical protein
VSKALCCAGSCPFYKEREMGLLALSSLVACARKKFSVFVLPHLFPSFLDN